MRWAKPLLFALCAGLACAGEPTAIIRGPASALPGDLVVLDAAGSSASGFAWVLADSDKSFLPVEDGRRLVFATSAAGRYTFVLVAADATSNGQPRVALAKHLLTIGQAPGPDPPAPGPSPGPDPLPPGRFGLATQARDWVAAVNLPVADRLRTAQQVAGAFETVATAIVAGTIATIPDALEKLVAANQAALGSAEYGAWKTGWNPRFQQTMQGLDQAGSLPGVKDVADAFREIAIGLRAAK